MTDTILVLGATGQTGRSSRLDGIEQASAG